MFYETLRSIVATRRGGSPTTVDKLLCGALAGVAAQTVTYPMDVVRRRMQMTGSSEYSEKYTGMVDACRKMFAKEGIRGFFKGMIPNYLKVAPAMGVSFMSYEWSKKVLGTQ